VTLILLTNDDGIDAQGLRVLEESIEGLGEIIVLAPDRERSAVSHGLTLRSPLELNEVKESHYSLTGTPADCVIYALSKKLSSFPDLVISGINHGANLADDIMYSGTVAAVREASRRGIPSIAFSQAYDDEPIRFDKGKKFIRTLIRTVLEKKLDRGLCLNVNIPVRRIRGVKITRQGCALHFPHFNSHKPRAVEVEANSDADAEGRRSGMMLDYEAISEHFISVTPLQRDQTNYSMAEILEKDAPELFRRFWIPGLGLIGK
jgi:5'-nucleotidase